MAAELVAGEAEDGEVFACVEWYQYLLCWIWSLGFGVGLGWDGEVEGEGRGDGWDRKDEPCFSLIDL